MWRHHWSPPYPSVAYQKARILKVLDDIEARGRID